MIQTPMGTQEPLSTSTDSPLETTPPVAHEQIQLKKNKKWIQIIPIAGIVILLMGTLVVLTSTGKSHDVRSRAALTGPLLTLAPATKTAKIGETFAIGMTINTQADTVSAAELHMSYDPEAIQIVSFTPGIPLPTVLTSETHTNGTIAVVLGAQPTSPFKGAGIIGTWSVKILAAKKSSIIITSATQVAALGKATNALAQATGSTITGEAANGLAATPTPTPREQGNHTIPTATPTPLTNQPSTISPTSTESHTGFGNIIAPTNTPTQIESPVTIMPPINTTRNELPQSDTTLPPAGIPEPAPPTTNIFQQILTGILQFFQGLFKK